MSLLDRVESVSTRKEPFKILLYGRPGSGKTKLACEAPGPLVLNVERGVRTLKNHAHLLDTPILTPTSFEEITQIFFELKMGAHPEYETVIIDTITSLERKRLQDSVKAAAARDGGSRSPYLPFQNDYKENGEALKAMCMAFAELPRNLIIVAHDVEIQDDDKTIKLRPAVTPKLAETLLGMMDAVLHLSQDIAPDGKVTRKLRTAESRRVMAKSRLNFDTDEVINPTFKDITDANERTATKPVGITSTATAVQPTTATQPTQLIPSANTAKGAN